MSDHPYQLSRSAEYKVEHYKREARVARQLPKRHLRRRAAHFMLAVARWLEPDLNLSFPQNRERTLS